MFIIEGGKFKRMPQCTKVSVFGGIQRPLTSLRWMWIVLVSCCKMLFVEGDASNDGEFYGDFMDIVDLHVAGAN